MLRKNIDKRETRVTDAEFRDIWRNLCRALDEWDIAWRARSNFDSGAPARADPNLRAAVSNREAFEAFALALLSGNTRWDRIAAIREVLKGQLCDFDPRAFARLAERDLDSIVSWFRKRNAGAARLGSSLRLLRQTAAILAGQEGHQDAETMIASAFKEAENSPEGVAVLFGSKGDWKLPGFGIALAAEALRNLGFDLSKPDRHVTRAAASWGLVDFRKWDRPSAFSAPSAKPSELLSTMLAVRRMAFTIDRPVTRTSSAIWLAGSVSGARLPNRAFEEMANRTGSDQ